MRTLAKKHRVRIEESKIAGVSDVMEALKTLPPATENACVRSFPVTAESDLRVWSTALRPGRAAMSRVSKIA